MGQRFEIYFACIIFSTSACKTCSKVNFMKDSFLPFSVTRGKILLYLLHNFFPLLASVIYPSAIAYGTRKFKIYYKMENELRRVASGISLWLNIVFLYAWIACFQCSKLFSLFEVFFIVAFYSVQIDLEWVLLVLFMWGSSFVYWWTNQRDKSSNGLSVTSLACFLK